jgi:cobalt/nickel transport system permease protein
MHIPDGFLSSEVNAAAFAVSGVVVAAAVWRANKTLGEKQAPLLGVTAAFVFAAQMLNFPIGVGVSGHFLGALMCAVLLGPLNAVLVLTVVLVIQCLVFGDGGLTALGANVFNMGIIGGLGGYAVFVLLRFALPKTKGALMGAAAVASWVSVVGASAVAALELGFSGTCPLAIVLPLMLGSHALIGIGEAVITVAVLSAVLAARPDLVPLAARAQEA